MPASEVEAEVEVVAESGVEADAQTVVAPVEAGTEQDGEVEVEA